jgi:hypothetical protein
MRSRPTTNLYIGQPPVRPRWRLVLALLILCATVAGLVGFYCYWRRTTVAGVAARGLALLNGANTLSRVIAALDEWERQTARYWHARRDELINYLLKHGRLSDPRVRLLLARVSGADYGDRPDEWKRWLQTRKALEKGEQPRLTGLRRVRLEKRWEAPVGLTAWFTTILPLDGQIYVASLGSSFGDPHDAADGIVRVDGLSGQSELLFQPTESGPGDMLGIAANNNGLVATCQNGLVYSVAVDGSMRWSARVGAGLCGPPLSLDLNRDGFDDVVVARRSGDCIALDGRNGTTLWTAAAPKRSKSGKGSDTGSGWAGLAAGSLTSDTKLEIVVATFDGLLRVLAAENGSVRSESTISGGTVSGVVVSGGAGRTGPPAYLADRTGGIWAMIRSGRTMENMIAGELALHSDDTIIAPLRTLGRSGGPPALVACTAGPYTADQATTVLLEPAGIRWRYPVGGAVWGAPAVGDISGDGEPELVICSISPGADQQPVGTVTVLSAAGQCVWRQVMPAPIECSPVIADVDGDMRLEVLVADQRGWLHCYATGRIGPVEWGLAAGDSHNTRNREHAYSFGQTPCWAQLRWKPR